MVGGVQSVSGSPVLWAGTRQCTRYRWPSTVREKYQYASRRYGTERSVSFVWDLISWKMRSRSSSIGAATASV